MPVFDLHWLRGPASSVNENFEVLCLELLREEFPGCGHFRLSSPDCGIDILGTEPFQQKTATVSGSPKSLKVAYQCKAYARFSFDLHRAIGASMASAISVRAHSTTLTWDRFAVILPQLLTAMQRERLHTLWTRNQLPPDIRDIDWIERLLYQHGDVRARFFPEFVVVLPNKGRPLEIGFPNGSEGHQQLVLYLSRFEQRLPLECSPDLTVQGLISILIDELHLPTQAQVHSITTSNFAIEWDLYLTSSRSNPLDRMRTIRDLELPRGAEVVLVHSLQITLNMSYFGSEPPSGVVALYDKRSGWGETLVADEARLDQLIEQRAAAGSRNLRTSPE